MINPTEPGYHSCASLAVKAAVNELKRRLSTRFSFLPGIPDFFFDFEKGVSEQFKQYYAKVPQKDRNFPWLVLAYSYDSTSQSSIQPRNGLEFKRTITPTIKRNMDFQYVDLPILFSCLTNDSKLFNALSAFLIIKANWSFSCKYEDLLWPTWIANTYYPLGWYIRPSISNGKLYMCSRPGMSGDTEPIWETEVSSTQDDNEVEWTCTNADTFTVRAANFVKNDSVISNPIENGIMYQLDFGFTLHFTEIDDGGKLTGVITEIEMNLLNLYRNGMFGSLLETIKVPS